MADWCVVAADICSSEACFFLIHMTVWASAWLLLVGLCFRFVTRFA